MRPKHLYMVLMYLSEGIAVFFLFGMWLQQTLLEVLRFGLTAFAAIIVSIFFHYLVYLEARNEEVDKR